MRRRMGQREWPALGGALLAATLWARGKAADSPARRLEGQAAGEREPARCTGRPAKSGARPRPTMALVSREWACAGRAHFRPPAINNGPGRTQTSQLPCHFCRVRLTSQPAGGAARTQASTGTAQLDTGQSAPSSPAGAQTRRRAAPR